MGVFLKNEKLPILIVDDEEVHLDFITRHLQSYFDNPIIGFQDPAEAFKWVQNNQAILCLFDYRMPGFSGIDLVKKVRRQEGYGEIPIILVTSENSRDLVSEIFDAGFTDYDLKPIQRSELFARVNTALK